MAGQRRTGHRRARGERLLAASLAVMMAVVWLPGCRAGVQTQDMDALLGDYEESAAAQPVASPADRPAASAGMPAPGRGAGGAAQAATGEVVSDDAIQTAGDRPRWPEGTWLESRRNQVIAFNLGAVLAIITFGALAWDYGSANFEFRNEGWFAHDSKYGGADKMGHAWTTYAMANLYTHLYRHWGFRDDEVALYSALSAWGQMAVVELGDGFSGDHGFSWEDLVANTVGATMAYIRQRSPRVKETVDFRVEWIPTPQFRRGHRPDPFTDYSGQRYVLALKLGGLLQSEHPLLRATELHLGYYTRGYVSRDDRHDWPRERRFAYAGVGLNVTYLLERTVKHNLWNVFDYVQAPYTYLPVRYSFE